MPTMKEAATSKDLKVVIRDVDVPKAAAGEVLIEVKACGSNPKDWKTELVPSPDLFPINLGDDIAGIVAEVGEGVVGFKPGDRVFAFHKNHGPSGGWARFAIAPAHMTAPLPLHVSFEAAVTVPLAGITAALAMYRVLGLPQPWVKSAPAHSQQPTPLLVYGASSALGAFAIKMANLSGVVHPIIAIAGAGGPFVKTLLDPGRGDVLIDYRGKSAAELEAAISAALSGGSKNEGGEASAAAAAAAAHATPLKLRHAFDAVSIGSSTQVCVAALDKSSAGGLPSSFLAVAMPPADFSIFPQDGSLSWGIPVSPEVFGVTFPGMPDGDPRNAEDFGATMMQAFARWLHDGRMEAHPFEVVPGGLKAVQQILLDIRDGKASAKKFVFRPGEVEV